MSIFFRLLPDEIVKLQEKQNNPAARPKEILGFNLIEVEVTYKTKNNRA